MLSEKTCLRYYWGHLLYLSSGITRRAILFDENRTIAADMPTDKLLENIELLIKKPGSGECRRGNAERSGFDLVELLTYGYSAGVEYVGELFSRGKAFLPKPISSTQVLRTVMTEFERKMAITEVQLISAKVSLFLRHLNLPRTNPSAYQFPLQPVSCL
jgi:hypothetical protein